MTPELRQELDMLRAKASGNLPQPGGINLPMKNPFNDQQQGGMTPELQQELKALRAKAGGISDAQPSQPKPYNRLLAAANAVGQGVTFGLNDELGAGVNALYQNVVNKVPLSEAYTKGLENVRNLNKAYSDERPVESTLLNVGGALLTGGAGASTKAGTALANSYRTGNAFSRIAQGGLVGAASGGAYGFGTGEGGATERLNSAGENALVGGLLGAGIPAVSATGAALARGVQSAAVPKNLSEATKQLASRANDFGIPLTLNQIAPTKVRKTVQKVSQELPFSGVDDFEAKQLTAYHKALAETIGQQADNLSPDVIKSFRAENSKKFDNAFNGVTFNFTNMIKKDLDGIADEARSTIDANLSSIVKKNVDDVWKQVRMGRVPGEKLASIRSQLLSRMTGSQSSASPFIGQIIDKIDDITAAQLPADRLASLKEARRQYRNYKTLQPLLEKSTDGYINPTQVLDKIAANKYINASQSSIGEDDLIDLARIGKEFMPKLGGSDTVPTSIMAGGGAAIGLSALDNPLAAAAIGLKAGAGLAANRAFQKRINQNQSLVKQAVGGNLPRIEQRNIPTITIRPSDRNR